MRDKSGLKGVARQAYLSYHQDGIIDIIVGIGIIGFGLMMLTGSVVFGFLTWMPTLFYVPLKNQITIPRFGYVRFTGEQEQRRKLFMVALIGVMTLSLFTGIVVFMIFDSWPFSLRELLSEYIMLILSGFFTLAALAAAVFTGLWRFIGYALIGIAITIIGIQLSVPDPYYVILIGIIILLAGLGLLIRFLREYPKSDEDWNNAGS